MLNVLSKIGNAGGGVLLIIAQLVPLLTELKAQHGQALSADEKASISGVAMASFSTIEGISGKVLAADPDIQAAITAGIEAFSTVQALVLKKHLATVPAA
jgi:hypothetical protein